MSIRFVYAPRFVGTSINAAPNQSFAMTRNAAVVRKHYSVAATRDQLALGELVASVNGSDADARVNLVRLDTLESQRNNNYGDGTKYIDVYNGAVNDAGPSQTINSFTGGIFRTNVPGSSSGQTNVWYVDADCAPYTSASHWLRGHIMEGTWNQNINRMSVLFRGNYNGPAFAIPGTHCNIGTYIKNVDDFTSGAEGSTGYHYYHAPQHQVYANRWVKVVITACPIHGRGEPGSQDHTVVTDYFHKMTRCYWQRWAGWSVPISSTMIDDIAAIELYQVDGHDDDNIRDLTIQHTTGDSSGRYEVGFNARKNVNQTFDIRYRTDGVAFSAFSGGNSGGTVTNPGDDYTACMWTSSTMDEESNGIYVAIQLQGQSGTPLWSQIYLPYQVSETNTSIPVTDVS
jgi:hypothetical protein